MLQIAVTSEGFANSPLGEYDLILLDYRSLRFKERLYLTGLRKWSFPRDTLNVFSWTAVLSHLREA